MTLLDGLGLQVRVANEDVTRHTTGLTFSAVDPGGYETCTLNLADVENVNKGAPVVVLDGTGDVWWGRVEEPGQRLENGRVAFNVSAVGAGAALKDNPYQCIYIDRDLTVWQGPSRDRRLDLITFQLTEPRVDPDVTSGEPCITTELVNTWAKGLSESWYDAGDVARVGAIAVEWANSSGRIDDADVNWDWDAFCVDDDGSGSEQRLGGNLRSTGIGNGRFTVPSTRFVFVSLSYPAAGGAADANYPIQWRKVAVFGDHGLPVRGSNPGGLWPSDIVRHALKQSRGILPGVVETASGLTVAHSVYREPTPPEKVIDDMAKLMGWHWGVWGPDGILDDTPRLHFRAPPPQATASVSRTMVGDLDLTDRLSDVYDSVQVAFTDAAGKLRYETVEIANPNMPDGMSRQAQAQIGLSTPEAARAFGRFWLLLSQRTVRAAGSGTLPATVAAPGGGTRRALTLKPGIDRLRITDLPSTGQNLLETDTRRFDTFRLSRTETTVEAGGAPVTRVEFDSGANLLDTLQVRLDTATQVAVGR